MNEYPSEEEPSLPKIDIFQLEHFDGDNVELWIERTTKRTRWSVHYQRKCCSLQQVGEKSISKNRHFSEAWLNTASLIIRGKYRFRGSLHLRDIENKPQGCTKTMAMKSNLA